MIHQAGGDIDDMAFALFLHLGNRQLGDVEEAIQVHGQHVDVVFVGIAGEGFGDEDPGVVDQAVDATKYANYPLALAPGMGLNAYFAFSVVGGMKVPWQVALGAVFLSGVLFLCLAAAPCGSG